MTQLFTATNHVATPGALEALEAAKMPPHGLLARHYAGDFGEVPPEDADLNRLAIADGSRIISAYTLPGTDVKVWVITEGADDKGQREATTILLPEEY